MRSPVGLNVIDAEIPPVTGEDAKKSEYKDIRLRATRAELWGHKTDGTFASDGIPKGVNIITAKWAFRWDSTPTN